MNGWLHYGISNIISYHLLFSILSWHSKFCLQLFRGIMIISWEAVPGRSFTAANRNKRRHCIYIYVLQIKIENLLKNKKISKKSFDSKFHVQANSFIKYRQSCRTMIHISLVCFFIWLHLIIFVIYFWPINVRWVSEWYKLKQTWRVLIPLFLSTPPPK